PGPAVHPVRRRRTGCVSLPRSSRSFRAREPNAKRRAAPDFTAEGELARMLFNDGRVSERQTLAGALADALGRKEWLHHSLTDGFRDPAAVVFHFQLHEVSQGPAADHELAGMRSRDPGDARGDGVGRVDD